jgi:glucosamine-6-phosphate deaminase
LLGIGRTGHVGFNEPGSHINSGTRITLDHITRVDASSDFNGTANVPKIAITMGFYYFAVKRIVLLAWGQNKADIIKEQFRKTSALKFRYVFAESQIPLRPIKATN